MRLKRSYWRSATVSVKMFETVSVAKWELVGQGMKNCSYGRMGACLSGPPKRYISPKIGVGLGVGNGLTGEITTCPQSVRKRSNWLNRNVSCLGIRNPQIGRM